MTTRGLNCLHYILSYATENQGHIWEVSARGAQLTSIMEVANACDMVLLCTRQNTAVSWPACALTTKTQARHIHCRSTSQTDISYLDRYSDSACRQMCITCLYCTLNGKSKNQTIFKQINLIEQASCILVTQQFWFETSSDITTNALCYGDWSRRRKAHILTWAFVIMRLMMLLDEGKTTVFKNLSKINSDG